MWTICFFISTGYCAFLVYQTVNNYLNYDVVTTIDVIDQVPSQFPTVSICNANSLVTTNSILFARRFLKANNITDPFNYSFISKQMDSLPLTQKILIIRYFIGSYLLEANLSDTFRKSMGLNQSDFILSCMFNSLECSNSDFEWYFDLFYGNCFRFNGATKKPYKNSTRSGFFYGLRLELFVGETNDKFSFSTQSGAVVFVNNHTVTPFFTEGITVPVGTTANIALSREFIYKVERPYSDCVRDLTSLNSYDSELYRKVIQSGKEYRQKDCFGLCFQKYLLNECKCQESSFIKYSDRKSCFWNLSDLICNYEKYLKFFSKDVRQECSDECPLECDSVSYSLSSSYLSYPTRAYSDILLNDPKMQAKFTQFNYSLFTHERLKENILSLNVYYDQLKYTTIREMIKTTPSDLVAIVGGILGLFLGMSFLSFIELLEIFLEIICILLENALKSSKSSKITHIKVQSSF